MYALWMYPKTLFTLCSWHLLMEEKKLLAKLNAFALHHTLQNIHIMSKTKKTSINIDYAVHYYIYCFSKRIAKISFVLDECRKMMISYFIRI